MDSILGAYGDGGIDDFCDGEPKPDMPLTEYLLLAEVVIIGRAGGSEGGMLLKVWRLEADWELAREGGVVWPPCVELKVEEDFAYGTELEFVDVLVSVRTVDLDRRLKKGAMASFLLSDSWVITRIEGGPYLPRTNQKEGSKSNECNECSLARAIVEYEKARGRWDCC
jgi:hypothetical protein